MKKKSFLTRLASLLLVLLCGQGAFGTLSFAEQAAVPEDSAPEITDQMLFEKAVEAMKNAYIPYSHFPVGACLLAEDGRIFTGCNIENASYGATICAERCAVCQAVAQGAQRFTAIAVVGQDTDAWPCGICRQVLNEFGPNMKVICGNEESGQWTSVLLSDLLPNSFGPEELSE